MTAGYSLPGVKTNRINSGANSRPLVGMVNVGIIAEGDGGAAVEAKTEVRATSGVVDFVDTLMTDTTDVKYKGYSFSKNVDYTVAAGAINWVATSVLDVPYLRTVASEVNANNFPVGTKLYYKITAIKTITSPSTLGETTASNEVSITMAAAQAVRLTWIGVSQAEGYRIYRGTVAGAETYLTEVLGEVTTWLDQNVYVPTAVTVPAANTATRMPPLSLAGTAGSWTGALVAVPATTAATMQAIDLGIVTLSMDGATDVIVSGMTFTAITTGSATIALNDCAAFLQDYIGNATGTAATYASGDSSVNSQNIHDLTDAVVAIGSDNLAINGNFALNGYKWTLGAGWAITALSKKATATASSATLAHTLAGTANSYRLTYTLSGVTAGTLTASIGGTSGTAKSANGTYTEVLLGAGATVLTFTAAAFTGSISDISVQRIYQTAIVDLTTCITMAAVATKLQTAVNLVTSAAYTFSYANGIMTVTSPILGNNSRISIETPTAGTNIALANYLDFVHGAEKRGLASAATVTYNSTTTKFKATSATTGTSSTMVMKVTAVPGSMTDVFATGKFEFVGGVAASGTVGTPVTYDINAVISGANYFIPTLCFTPQEVADMCGQGSDLYAQAAKVMLPPPLGNGGKMVTACAVPSMSRTTAAAAMAEMGKVDMDILIVMTDDLDIGRDMKSHVLYFSAAAQKKERCCLIAAKRTLTKAQLATFAAELNSKSVGLVFDNYSTDDFIPAVIAGTAAAQPDRATSVINSALIVPGYNATQIFDSESAIEYLCGSGVMMVAKNPALGDLFCVRDDIMTGGDALTGDNDFIGVLTENYVRKALRNTINGMIGTNKLTDDLIRSMPTEIKKLLDSLIGTIIDSYTPNTIVATRDSVKRSKVKITFKYNRIYTFKECEINYDVI